MNESTLPQPDPPQDPTAPASPAPYKRRYGGGRNELHRLAERIGVSTKPSSVKIGEVQIDGVFWLPTDPPRPAPFIMTAEDVLCMLRFECAPTETSRHITRMRSAGLRGFRLYGLTTLYRLPDVLDFIEEHVFPAKPPGSEWKP